MEGDILQAIIINAALSIAAIRMRALDVLGAALMGIMGFWIYYALGWRGFLLPVVFFALGSLFTRLGYERKRSRRVAQRAEGVRSVREVLANGLVPSVLVVPILLVDPRLFAIGYTAAWATALCDTSATELGGLLGGRTVLARTFRPVSAGTPGAVSLEGTAAGLAAALFLALIAFVEGLIGLYAVLPVAAAAMAGSFIESLLAGVLPPGRRMRHELLNIANTVAGGGIALIWGVFLLHAT